MKSNLKFFKKSKVLPVDKFLQNVLYDNKFGYYATKYPFGKKGDFITAPKISSLFSEVIGIWLISSWEIFGKPKNFNIIELGPGDGSLTKILLKIFDRFPEFKLASNFYLYETSNYLKMIQKKNIQNKKIKWTNDLEKIKKGPVVFFGNEFFDAIPIKQFIKKKNTLYEKYFLIDKNNCIKEFYKKTSRKNANLINGFKSLKNLKFIEFPKLGLMELNKIIKKISSNNGCLLLIDYGYLNSNNQNTLQSVMKHKRNNLLNNLGKADITSNVNFELLKEFFLKNNLKVKKIVTQKFFLEDMGIIERANILCKKMKFREQSDLYLRLKRLLDPRLMGSLFKVILSYKCKSDKFLGFK
ncbi:SAM-dependent methyltransferase [Pelagibacteraceae bacterium]|jgi:NADH dehydrogenase [ubiquinone] 1 alpha subcomplex assembly factor 7|nr:SAM-dependent methyltransferase [Pelagibacteraceae bacterium]MDC0952518.1 SAM-dependent methyltransferase [Pelagibacteraceae bacterium]